MTQTLEHNKIVSTRRLVSGEEAAALGALDAGVRFVTGYPGAPGIDLVESLVGLRRPGMHVEWSTNERVAFEVALGAALCGQRALTVVKMEGANVLADSLLHSVQHGSRGGLVLFVGEDVGGHVSAIEQDTRLLGMMADMPILEPFDVASAYEMMRFAFSLSESVNLPVMVRGVGSVMAAFGLLQTRPPELVDRAVYFDDPLQDQINLGVPNGPVVSHARLHASLEQAQQRLTGTMFDTIQAPAAAAVGIIASGAGISLAREALERLQLDEQVALMQIGVVNPLNEAHLADFLGPRRAVLVLEEGEALIELRAAAVAHAIGSRVQIIGKRNGTIPVAGELSLDLVQRGLQAAFQSIGETLSLPEPSLARELPLPEGRGIALCPGCPHQGSFYALAEAAKQLAGAERVVSVGDAGCSILRFFQPVKSGDTSFNMGAAISIASGIALADPRQPAVAVIGDGGMFHSGLPALINAAYTNAPVLVLVLDNVSIANTGLQPTPGSGFNIIGEARPIIDLVELCRSCGISTVEVVNPLDFREATNVLEQVLAGPLPAVVVAREPCALVRLQDERRQGVAPRHATILPDLCTGCGDCLDLSCPIIVSVSEAGPAVRPVPPPHILSELCTGCGMCVKICPDDAIIWQEAN